MGKQTVTGTCGFFSICIKPLIHGPTNLTKFIESNKFDNYAAKFDAFLSDQTLKK